MRRDSDFRWTVSIGPCFSSTVKIVSCPELGLVELHNEAGDVTHLTPSQAVAIAAKLEFAADIAVNDKSAKGNR